MSHPVDQLAATHPGAAEALALEPVRCIDCEQYVPFGWIDSLRVKCPKNIGATGVQYGHRIPTEVYIHIKDQVFNRFSAQL